MFTIMLKSGTEHANKIIAVIKNVFNDIGTIASLPVNSELLDDDILDDWNELFQDDELYNLNIDNLTVSHLNDSTMGEDELPDDSFDEMPPAVLAAVESMALDH